MAEDNPVNRHIVGLQLSKLGVKAMIVENGEEAVKALASDLERKFNLVLMDIQVRGEGGEGEKGEMEEGGLRGGGEGERR